MSSNPYRKADHISYRKPGPNRIVDGILIIPEKQLYEEYFSFRAADGQIIREMPIDISKVTNDGLLMLVNAIGLTVDRGRWIREREYHERVVRPLVQEHLHIEDVAYIEAARLAREERVARQRTELETLIATLSAELADLEEAFYWVKPAVSALLVPRITALKAEIAVHNARLEGRLDM